MNYAKPLDIPLGKALVPVEKSFYPERCQDCYFYNTNCYADNWLACFDFQRNDGKNVIFKLVDWPPTEDGQNAGNAGFEGE